jgi:hypothetical protein
MDLNPEERDYLRSLARRQKEIASLPVMEHRKKMWTAMNDGVPGARPPFAIESGTFDRDFMPASIFRCASPYGRRLEGQFLRAIRHHEILNDDHVCPDTLDMGYHVHVDEYGIEIKTHHVKDAQGIETGYHFDCPIEDLAEGFAMVKPSTFHVDREGTRAEQAFLNETFGDILPVTLRSGTYGRNCLTQRLMRLISMENFFMAFYDAPDQVHGILGLLRDNARRLSLWAEAEGLLVLNNGNQTSCGTCYNFTTLLPKSNGGGATRLSDMWSVMDSQETVGVSPELFHEFIFPYYRDLAELFGLVYWGCCEPVDPIWEKSLSKLPNLKAVSISRWADQAFMARALDGKGIVYSRKPNPNLLGVDVALNEAAWRAELRSTLDALKGRNVPLEFVVRDVYTMHGNLGKARRAVELAREEIDKDYPALGA